MWREKRARTRSASKCPDVNVVKRIRVALDVQESCSLWRKETKRTDPSFLGHFWTENTYAVVVKLLILNFHTVDFS